MLPFDPSTRSGSRAESRDRLTAPSSVEGWFENLTTLSPVDGQLHDRVALSLRHRMALILHGPTLVICYLLCSP